MGASKRGQLKNNKYKDQIVLQQKGEDKDSCPKCKKYVRDGVKCGVCDIRIHYKWEEITQQEVEEEYPYKIPYICSKDTKQIEEKITRQWKAKYQELIQENNSAQEKIKTMKKKVKEAEKSYSELKDTHQRTKSNRENIKKELQKMKQEKETGNHEIETLRKLNKVQIQAMPDKEKEIRRLTAILEKEKERVDQMKSQVLEQQAENKNMNEMNTMTTKTNHYQELIKTMEKEKGIKQTLVTDNTVMKIEIQKLTSEIQREQNEQKERSKEIERLKSLNH